jgi:selenide, water dikinase
LTGAQEGDDAAVLRLDADRALVLTTDFFTPIVDDAYDWGRIAAANARPDVCAMAGRPLIAVSTDPPGELLKRHLPAAVTGRAGDGTAGHVRVLGGE